jgi:hypothetical protein
VLKLERRKSRRQHESLVDVGWPGAKVATTERESNPMHMDICITNAITDWRHATTVTNITACLCIDQAPKREIRGDPADVLADTHDARLPITIFAAVNMCVPS